MDFKKINKQLLKIEREIENIEESSITELSNRYFISKEDIEMLIPNYEFNFLSKLHLRLYKLINNIKLAQLDINDLKENNKILEKLLRLKIKIDRIITSNPNYNKSKFTKTFKEEISSYKNEYLIYQGKRNKTAFLNELVEYLINENYLDENHKDDFKQLFRKMKKFSSDKKVLWKKDIVELRGFYEGLSQSSVVKTPRNSDLFVELHFTHIEKANITKDYFANLKKRDRCQDYINDWIDILNKIEQID